MTECIQTSFEFAGPGGRTAVARFDGETMSSDGGALLLQRTDRRLQLLERAAACFQDHHEAWLVKHGVEQMLAQRVYGLALGYEDLSDHDQLRQDPLLALSSQLLWNPLRRRPAVFLLASRTRVREAG